MNGSPPLAAPPPPRPRNALAALVLLVFLLLIAALVVAGVVLLQRRPPAPLGQRDAGLAPIAASPPAAAAPDAAVVTPAPLRPLATPDAGTTHLEAPGRIALMVRSRTRSIRACHERALARRPRLAGRIVARFTIELDGSVREVRAEGMDEAPELGRCIEDVIREIRFGGPRRQRSTVSFPFVFAAD